MTSSRGSPPVGGGSPPRRDLSPRGVAASLDAAARRSGLRMLRILILLLVLLLVFGALGIYAEFSSPGLVLPGVLGAISLLLGLAALAMFPIGWLGATLVVLGLTFFVLEAKFATHGILTAGGAIALLLGALLLIDTNEPALRRVLD